jgi:two-component system NtrC family sensor kinase
MMSGERILVIDDRRENLLFLANSVLGPEGYEIITAIDGKQGLDRALAEKPHLIITDLKMPCMSGLELMAALRKEGVYTPVILTTFYGSEQAAIQAFRLGAKDYIIKPYDVQEMLKSVERALIEQRLRREAMSLERGIEVSQHWEERVRQLNSLCGIGRALTVLHDVEEVLRVSVEAAIYLTAAEAGQLFLIDGESQQLELRAVRGPSEARATLMRQVGADKVAAEAAASGKSIIAERDSGRRAKVPRLVVPLRTNEETLGVVAVDAKPEHSFSENDRFQVGILADFAAIAVSNARTISSLKDQAEAGAGGRGEASGRAAQRSPLPDLGESIDEARHLTRELRDLASTAQALANKLEAHRRSG